MRLHLLGLKKAFKHNRYEDEMVQEQVYSNTLTFSKSTNRASFDLKMKVVSSEEELSGFEFDGGKTAKFFELSEPALSLREESNLFTVRIDVQTGIT